MQPALELSQWLSGENRDPRLVEFSVAQNEAKPQSVVEAEERARAARQQRVEEKKREEEQKHEAKRTVRLCVLLR